MSSYVIWKHNLAIDEETNNKIIYLYFNQPKTIPDIVKIIRKSSRDVNVSKVHRKQTGAQKNATTKKEYQSNITYDRLKQKDEAFNLSLGLLDIIITPHGFSIFITNSDSIFCSLLAQALYLIDTLSYFLRLFRNSSLIIILHFFIRQIE